MAEPVAATSKKRKRLSRAQYAAMWVGPLLDAEWGDFEEPALIVQRALGGDPYFEIGDLPASESETPRGEVIPYYYPHQDRSASTRAAWEARWDEKRRLRDLAAIQAPLPVAVVEPTKSEAAARTEWEWKLIAAVQYLDVYIDFEYAGPTVRVKIRWPHAGLRTHGDYDAASDPLTIADEIRAYIACKVEAGLSCRS